MWQFEDAQTTWNSIFGWSDGNGYGYGYCYGTASGAGFGRGNSDVNGNGYGRGDGNSPWGSGYGGYITNGRAI